MDPGGTILPRSFTITDVSELRWKFPAFTIGEAVSTTLLSSSPHAWRFHTSADYSKADLCTIPLYKYEEYSDASTKLRGKQQFDFSAMQTLGIQINLESNATAAGRNMESRGVRFDWTT